jgi:hypothetical protein
MRKVLTVAEMTLRELVRRRRAIAFLLLLPLVFYVVRHEYVGQSVRSLYLGMGWAVSTAALFATTAGRTVDPRLVLSGYRSHQVYLGRLSGLWAAGAVLAVPFLLLIFFDVPGVRFGAVSLGLAFCVAVAAPFGLLIGILLPRELEGTLVLLTAVSMQMLLDPADALSKATPFWSSREIGTYAVDHTGVEYLTRGTLHGVAYTAGLVLLVGLVVAVRQRRRRHLRYAPEPEGVRA